MVSDATRKDCEKRGIDGVRALLISMDNGYDAQQYRHWVIEYDRLQSEAIDQRNFELAEKATAAAETSARAAIDSATEARSSAKTAKVSIVIAIIAVLAAVAQAVAVFHPPTSQPIQRENAVSRTS